MELLACFPKFLSIAGKETSGDSNGKNSLLFFLHGIIGNSALYNIFPGTIKAETGNLVGEHELFCDTTKKLQ